ncbi:phosphorylase family protein [Anaerospora hongkongensis]|uniref:phosphorylase family protein n=1 Tax=Anaerospora hongkongensis TaxID=244830 RepID=UPI00289F019D|nr:phosphorylase [Anaerospora hongkongensis]
MNLLKTDFAIIGDTDTLTSDFPMDTGEAGMEILADEMVFETPYGQSPVFRLFALDGRQVITCRLQGVSLVSDQSEEIRQAFWVLREVGVKRIIAPGCVRGINPLLEAGDIIIPEDYINLLPRSHVFLEGNARLIMEQALCPELRDELVESGRETGEGRIFSRGIYAVNSASPGESPAELALLKGHADITGHRLCPEVYLARQLGACYAGVYLVAGDSRAVDTSLLNAVVIAAVRNLAAVGNCDCKAIAKEMQRDIYTPGEM